MPSFCVRASLILGLLTCVCLPAEADNLNSPIQDRVIHADASTPGATAPSVPDQAAMPQLAQGGGPYWAPGGDMVNGMRVGSPYYWSGGYQGGGMSGYGYGAPAGYGYGSAGGYGYGGPGGYVNSGGGAYGYGAPGGYGAGGGDPYLYHFGPGYYRQNDYGHYRFPYYSYRRPWYFPGPPSYNRDTNLPW